MCYSILITYIYIYICILTYCYMYFTTLLNVVHIKYMHHMYFTTGHLSRWKSVLLVPGARSTSCLILVSRMFCFFDTAMVQLRVLHFVMWCSGNSWLGLQVAHNREVPNSLYCLESSTRWIQEISPMTI